MSPPAPPAEEAHDARARFEPGHGPTAVDGHWLDHQPGADLRPRVAARPAPRREAPEEALPSSRIVTPIEPSETRYRPTLVKLLSGLLGLLGVGFFGRFVWSAIGGAGLTGAGVAVIGLALAALGVWRIWAGHWDGLIPAVLFVLIVAGGALLLASAAAADDGGIAFTPSAVALLAGDGLAILLILLTASRSSGRDHLSG